MKYFLTKDEEDSLSGDDKKKYTRAKLLCQCENAGGPFGGWSDGHALLKEMGWTEKKRDDGFRSFVTLEKPQKKPNTNGKLL